MLLAFRGDGKRIESAELAEFRISEAVLREVPRLERFQSFLRLAVAAGPLLGLIGTVIGMIITFQAIVASGSSDPRLMAHGIGQAMIATVLGLGIAIPLLFINSGLATLSRGVTQILDEQATTCWRKAPSASRCRLTTEMSQRYDRARFLAPSPPRPRALFESTQLVAEVRLIQASVSATDAAPSTIAGAISTIVWIDLLTPTPEEERALEGSLGVDIPTREEMEEIEVSSRLYPEDGAAFMTATLPGEDRDRRAADGRRSPSCSSAAS